MCSISFIYRIVNKELLQICFAQFPLPINRFVSTSTLLKRDLKQVTISYLSSMAQVFVGKGDRFGGVTVDSRTEPCSCTELEEKLHASLNAWQEKNARGIWFRVSLEQSEWVPVLAKNGFVFHHAKPEYVMMCRWLPETEVSNIPRFAYTMIGVGAVVVNSQRQMLVVREKFYADIPHWKLPGGYVEQGEELADAAVREVLEETGISTQFKFLLTFRHTQGINFGCSDIYFIVCLEPLSSEIKKCEREIAACEWMKIEDYLESELVNETNKLFVQKYLKCIETGWSVSCQSTLHPILNRTQTIYSLSNDNTVLEKQRQGDC